MRRGPGHRRAGLQQPPAGRADASSAPCPPHSTGQYLLSPLSRDQGWTAWPWKSLSFGGISLCAGTAGEGSWGSQCLPGGSKQLPSGISRAVGSGVSSRSGRWRGGCPRKGGGPRCLKASGSTGCCCLSLLPVTLWAMVSSSDHHTGAGQPVIRDVMRGEGDCAALGRCVVRTCWKLLRSRNKKSVNKKGAGGSDADRATPGSGATK